MYFEGNITIAPTGVSKIEKTKPTKVFSRLLYHLTLGQVSDKQVKESFTAVSILQKLNMVFLKNGIDDIIRLSHDNIDFYLDLEGKKNDLKDAFDQYDLEIDQSMAVHFDQLSLVLEHDDDVFKYLIEVTINRTHEVGTHPIEIAVSGLLKEFKSSGNDQDNLKEKLAQNIDTQEKYDAFKINRLGQFETFIDNLKLSIKGLIKIDEVTSKVLTKVVIPQQKIQSQKDITYRKNDGYRGMYYGYYGFDGYLYYNMMWSSTCHNHNITLHDTHFESPIGEELGHLQEADTSSDHFNDEVDTSSEASSFFDDSDSTVTTSSSSGGGWFDSSNSDSDSSSCSSSSCSSCSSCGGD